MAQFQHPISPQLEGGNAIAAARDSCLWCHSPQPPRSMMVFDIAIEFNDGVPTYVFDALGLAVAFDVGVAAVKGPGHISNLPPNQRVVVRLTCAYCDLRLAFG